MRLLRTTIWVFLTLWGSLHAQSFLDQVSLEDGLSQSQLQCILQDSRGFMWFGTQHGLNRYDGVEMQHFYLNPFDSTTISQDDIRFLFEDSRHQLWVGVRQGLNRFDPVEHKFTRYDSLFANAELPMSQQITGIAEDAWNTLWISTYNGVWRFMPTGNTYKTEQFWTEQTNFGKATKSTIRSISADQQGNIWLGTAKGLYRIIVENPNAQPEAQKLRFEAVALPGQAVQMAEDEHFPIYHVFCDRNNILWVSAGKDLYKLDPRLSKAVQLIGQASQQQQPVTSMLVDRFGELWIGTGGSGIFRYQCQDNRLILKMHMSENAYAEKGLKSNFIMALYESNHPDEDLVWIGTREAGVQLYSRSKNSFRQWDQLLAKEQTSGATAFFGICTDSYGYLWAGTYDGLFRIDRRTNTYKKYLMDPQYRSKNAHQAILEDRSKTLWVGSDQGLFRYDRTRDEFVSVSLPEFRGKQPLIMRLSEDREGNIWVGTGSYLLHMQKQPDGQLIFKQIAANQEDVNLVGVSAIVEDPGGNFWIGTRQGLYQYRSKSKEFQRFKNNPKDPKSLIDNWILNVYCGDDGQIWVCSPRGLSKLIWENGKATFKHYTEKDGLPNSFVYGILPDKRNRLWLSTNAGLSCFNPKTEQFRNYDSNDGLASREFNSGAFHLSEDGEMFFGGLGVLVSFFPEQMIENQHLPKTAITAFRKWEEEVPINEVFAEDGSIYLNYKDDLLSFNLAALDFTNPSKNEFAYRLKGWQDNWAYIGNRRNISFTHLAPGDYTLEVKSANNQGRWNEDEILSVPIFIKPPFWQTWWFYTLAAILTGTLVISAYRYRVQMKVQRAVELERVKLEENERVRKLAAQDLHDEFGNTLTRISLLTELIKAKSLNGNGEVGSLLTKISDNANRMYQGTKDFIWAINPEHDSFYEVAIRLKDFGDDAFDTTGINFRVSGIDERLKTITLPMGTSRHLVMLFKEAISNTLKHAQASEVCLQFALENEQIEIIWTDNGVGFEPAKANNGNGLQNMHSRAKRIGAKVKIESLSENGTKVRVVLQPQTTATSKPNI